MIGIMKTKSLLLLLPLFLTGCLFSVNHPLVGPDGTIAVFLDEQGAYQLLLGGGALTLLRDGEAITLPATVVPEAGAVVDWSADGAGLLYVTQTFGEWGEPLRSALVRVAADPAAQPTVLLASDAPIRDAAYTADGRLVVLEFDGEVAGRLSLLDPEAGTAESLFENALGFRMHFDRDALTVLCVDLDGPVPIGRVIAWDLGTDAGETVARFVLEEEMLETFPVMSDTLLWDVDPSARFVALAVTDHVMIDPMIEDEVPALLLIDVKGRTAIELAPMALMPAFSPDGRVLAYIGSDDGDTGVAMVQTIDPLIGPVGEAARVPGGEGAATCFWLAPTRLGLAFELEDDGYRVVAVDLDTGEMTDLFE